MTLLISVIPNIIATVFSYIAIYFSLSRVDSLRQEAAQQEMVDAITDASSPKICWPITPNGTRMS